MWGVGLFSGAPSNDLIYYRTWDVQLILNLCVYAKLFLYIHSYADDMHLTNRLFRLH